MENNTINLDRPFESNSIYLTNIAMISIKNTTFNNKLHSLIYAENSRIYLREIVVSPLICSGELFECFGNFMKTQIKIINSTFMNICSFGKKNILLAINSQFHLYNSSFKPLKSQNANVVMSFKNSDLVIKETSFTNYTKGLMHIFGGSALIFDCKTNNEGNFNLDKKSNDDIFSTIKCEFCSLNIFNS